MCAPSAFDGFTVHNLWPRPALWCSQNDHRPRRWAIEAAPASILLNGFDFFHDRVERRSHELVHCVWFMPFNEIRLVPVTGKKLRQLRIAETGKNRGVGDLVAIEMQNGK